MMTNDEIVSVLNNLIETCKDGQKGFETSAQDVSNSDLKELFRGYAEDCRTAATELYEEVRGYGGDPETGGSTLGALHRGWVNIKSTVTGNDDLAILEECERGEDVAKASYMKALREDLPANIRMIVQSQYEGALRIHDSVSALRDQYRAAKG